MVLARSGDEGVSGSGIGEAVVPVSELCHSSLAGEEQQPVALDGSVEAKSFELQARFPQHLRRLCLRDGAKLMNSMPLERPSQKVVP